jgi:adenine-specific DNA-methyltransferase
MATAEEAERSPRIFKIIRLESYEDTLNNLRLRRTEAQRSLFDLPGRKGRSDSRSSICSATCWTWKPAAVSRS